MNVYKVIFYYIGILTVCGVFVHMLYQFITKKYKEKLSQEQLHKNPRIQQFQTAFYIGGIVFSGLCVFTIGVSGIRDFPFVLKNQYPHVRGEIVEVDKTSHGDFSVIIENDITKEKLDIGFIHKDFKEGEKVEVYYLPHLKIGSVYKIQ